VDIDRRSHPRQGAGAIFRPLLRSLRPRHSNSLFIAALTLLASAALELLFIAAPTPPASATCTSLLTKLLVLADSHDNRLRP